MKKHIESGKSLIGTMVSLHDASVVEMLVQCGFDWLFIDMEHSALNLSQMQQLLQACQPQCMAVVRAPWNDLVMIKRILDIGCDGIIIPMVRSANEARAAVAACLYPPLGTRSIGLWRAHGYGRNFAEYLESSNDNLAVIVQIEHIDAVNDIDAILQVPGITALFIGPYDLSASMGLTGQLTHPDVVAAIAKIKQRCEAAKMPLCIYAATAETAQQYKAAGYQLLIVGMDAMFLWQQASSVLDAVKTV